MQVQSLGWEDLLEEGMESTSVFLPGESHEQRSLVSYSPWGHKELDMIERLTLSLFLFIADSCYCTAEPNTTVVKQLKFN